MLPGPKWGFPRGTPSYHPFIDGIVHTKPTILGVPPVSPSDGNPQMLPGNHLFHEKAFPLPSKLPGAAPRAACAVFEVT